MGFVIRFENGFTVYHAGDTAVFSDMKIIGDLYKPDLALLPIGSLFTMDPAEAAYACKLIQPKYVVPMHYGTWPVLTGTEDEFARLLKDQPGIKLIAMDPGATVEQEFKGASANEGDCFHLGLEYYPKRCIRIPKNITPILPTPDTVWQ